MESKDLDFLLYPDGKLHFPTDDTSAPYENREEKSFIDWFHEIHPAFLSLTKKYDSAEMDALKYIDACKRTKERLSEILETQVIGREKIKPIYLIEPFRGTIPWIIEFIKGYIRAYEKEIEKIEATTIENRAMQEENNSVEKKPISTTENYFSTLLREQSPKTYAAILKAIDAGLINKIDEGRYNFNCSPGAIRAFFAKGGFTKWKEIGRFVLQDNKPLCKSFGTNSTEPKSAEQIEKYYE